MSDDCEKKNKPEIKEKKLAKEEGIKTASNYLQGNIAEELSDSADCFSKDAVTLLKFHGMYQQDDRDKRIKTDDGKQKFYSLMIRGRIPGGRLTAAQYAMWDDLATEYGSGSIRLTTRQSIQLHGVLKSNVKKTIQAIHEALLTTTGACGDVVRNVTQAVNPLNLPELTQLDAVSQLLSDHFKAATPAYAEIWLDGEKVPSETIEEPLYGKTYLPRKFKIAVTIAGNNTIDLYTNDMGFAATLNDANQIDGFFVFAGGGLGMTHDKPETFPRAADLLGWIPESALITVAEAIVTTHRDFGDRTNRKHARLKYVIADRGIAWFRQEVENRSGIHFDQQRALPVWDSPSYLGWHLCGDGTWSLGFHTLAGRIIDRPGHPLKSALREIISAYHLPVQLTADQDLILLAISNEAKAAIESRFAALQIDPASPAPLYDRALACVALPTCGLAITEAERYLPDLLSQIQDVLKTLELSHRAPVIRMTGCPNGCARPYSAELGLVGRTVGVYGLYVGGDYEGTRIAQLLDDEIPATGLLKVVYGLFELWKTAGEPEERFGDFAHRTDLESLRLAALSGGRV